MPLSPRIRSGMGIESDAMRCHGFGLKSLGGGLRERPTCRSGLRDSVRSPAIAESRPQRGTRMLLHGCANDRLGLGMQTVHR